MCLAHTSRGQPCCSVVQLELSLTAQSRLLLIEHIPLSRKPESEEVLQGKKVIFEGKIYRMSFLSGFYKRNKSQLLVTSPLW